MNLKNGYKVVYEIAANGERTFYAAKSSSYPTRNENGEIIDTVLATFKDADYLGKTIYEYAGEFYVADTTAAKFDEEGKPTGDKIKGFDAILVEESVETTQTTSDEGLDAGNDDETIPEEDPEEPEDIPEEDPENPDENPDENLDNDANGESEPEAE